MPKIFINNGGTLREMRKIFINNGGTLRNIRKVFINDGGTLRLVFDALTSGISLVWTSLNAVLRGYSSSAPTTARIWFNHDGTVVASVDNKSANTLTGQDWHSLAPSVTSSTDTWTVKVDAISVPKPAFDGLLEGVEYPMTETRLFTLKNEANNSEGIYTLNITFDDKMGKIVAKSLSLWMPVGTPP